MGNQIKIVRRQDKALENSGIVLSLKEAYEISEYNKQ